MPILVNCECGKQFQAKDENIDRRFLCTECGRELTVAAPQGIPPIDAAPVDFGPVTTKTSGKAIASLVLGILSFVCFFFTGLPAVILGIIGLSDIGRTKGLSGKGLAISGIVLGSLSSLLLVPILLALMIPAVQAGREAARRAQCVNNLKQVGIAFNNMDSREDHFPADSIKDANGKPLLSWRVAILPYIDQEALYKEFKLDEPWDSPTNQALLARMPGTYRCPSDPAAPGMTRYEAIVGAGTAFEGGTPHTIKQITDGTANTILVIEGATPVPWTKPDDLDIAQVGSSIGGKHIRIANALFADGSVRSIKKDTAGAILQALATCAGGEMISPDAY